MLFIKLQSSEGVVFEVSETAAKQSVAIKMVLEDLLIGEGDGEVIPLPNVSTATLKKVIEWIEHHQDDTSAPEKNEAKEIWDQNYLQVDPSSLFALILAAIYLGIKGLVDAGTTAVANLIRGKTEEQIRQLFYIKNDFTPEEEEAIKKANEWFQ